LFQGEKDALVTKEKGHSFGGKGGTYHRGEKEQGDLAPAPREGKQRLTSFRGRRKRPVESEGESLVSIKGGGSIYVAGGKKSARTGPGGKKGEKGGRAAGLVGGKMSLSSF